MIANMNNAILSIVGIQSRVDAGIEIDRRMHKTHGIPLALNSQIIY